MADALTGAQVCANFAGLFVDLWQCGCRFACGHSVDCPSAQVHATRFLLQIFISSTGHCPVRCLAPCVVCLPAIGLFRCEGLVDCCAPGPGSGVVVFGLDSSSEAVFAYIYIVSFFLLTHIFSVLISKFL